MYFLCINSSNLFVIQQFSISLLGINLILIITGVLCYLHKCWVNEYEYSDDEEKIIMLNSVVIDMKVGSTRIYLKNISLF